MRFKSANSKANTALNAVCPYYTMFPLEIPMKLIQKYGKAGSCVADPFCGRGTTNFAARISGLETLGADVSPVAIAIAQAKVVETNPDDVVKEAKKILESREADVPNGVFWELAFSASTLRQVCALREELLDDCTTPARIVLRAIVMGALHGPRTKLRPSHLSNQSPRTFAPKPDYAVRYWTQNDMMPPEVNLLEVVEHRANRYLQQQIPAVPSQILLGDSKAVFGEIENKKIDLIITSPPYYGMRTYVPDQWLRNWFIGGPPLVDYRQPAGSIEHTSPSAFAEELGLVWKALAQRAENGARLIVRMGSINDRRCDPVRLMKASLGNTGWRIVTIKDAGKASDGKRQASQFGNGGKGKARKEVDVYARLSCA